MIHRHLKLVLVLLLPLFIARSVMPAGFMVWFDEGFPRLVFCPAQGTARSEPSGHEQSADAQPTHHHGHEYHHGKDQSDASDTGHAGSGCLFALAAAAPLVFAEVFVVASSSSQAIAEPPESLIHAVTSRAHPIRGPPAFPEAS